MKVYDSENIEIHFNGAKIEGWGEWHHEQTTIAEDIREAFRPVSVGYEIPPKPSRVSRPALVSSFLAPSFPRK